MKQLNMPYGLVFLIQQNIIFNFFISKPFFVYLSYMIVL